MGGTRGGAKRAAGYGPLAYNLPVVSVALLAYHRGPHAVPQPTAHSTTDLAVEQQSHGRESRSHPIHFIGAIDGCTHGGHDNHTESNLCQRSSQLSQDLVVLSTMLRPFGATNTVPGL